MKARFKGARRLRREQGKEDFQRLPLEHQQTIENFYHATADLRDDLRETLLALLLSSDEGDYEFSDDLEQLKAPLRAARDEIVARGLHSVSAVIERHDG